MIAKEKLLIFSHYLPAYKAGGPVHSVEGICVGLKSKFNITVISPNKDIDGTILDIKSFWGNKKADIKVEYKEKTPILWIYKFMKAQKFKFVYVNSFFIPILILKIIICSYLTGAKIIIAPRGQLSKGAISNKKLKKYIYIYIFRLLGKKFIYRFHATCNEEKKEINALLNVDQKKIEQISNIRILKIDPKNFNSSSKKNGRLNLVFFSRIVYKKNLLYIIESLNKYENKGVTLDIFGTIEDFDYWNICINEMKKGSNNISYKYKGVLKPSEVVTTLSNYDSLIFLTYNENFGHVIIEALFAGLPIILSPNTPFSSIINNNNLGFVCNIESPIDLLDIIEKMRQMSKLDVLKIKSQILLYLTTYKRNQRRLINMYKSLFTDVQK